METLGRFRHGRLPDLFLEATRDLGNIQLTKAHEGIHRILSYSSSHGMFLFTVLAVLESASPDDPRLPQLESLADILHRAEFAVQEGCATFLTLNMCMAAFGRHQADVLRARRPEDNHVAAGLLSDCLRATMGDPSLGPYVVKNLEFLVHGITLAAMNSRICQELGDPDDIDPENFQAYMLADGPEARLKRISDHLANRTNAESLVHAEEGTK